METLVCSGEDPYARAHNGWPKRAPPGLSNWQGGEYSYCSRFSQSSSDVCDQMSAIGGCYLPVNALPCGFHSTSEEHLSCATNVAKSQTFRSDNIKYSAVPTWLYCDVFSRINNQPEGRVLGMQGCQSAPPIHGWTPTRIRNNEIKGQAVCRFPSSCFVGKNSLQAVYPKMDAYIATGSNPIVRGSSLKLFGAKESPDTVGPTPSWSSLQRPKSSKILTHGAKITGRDDSSTSTIKCNSCKYPDVPAGGIFRTKDGALKSLASEARQGGITSLIGCVPLTAASNNHMKFVKESSAPDLLAVSINGAPLVSMEGGQEEERSYICERDVKGTRSNSRPCPERDVSEDHGEGLMPLDPIVTSVSSTPLITVKGCAQESSQSALSPPINERWAGPAFSNSPPPSSLPLPTFTKRTSSLEIPQAEVDLLADVVSILAPGTPSRSFSLPSVGTFQSHLDVDHATKSLRRLLNLDSDTRRGW